MSRCMCQPVPPSSLPRTEGVHRQGGRQPQTAKTLLELVVCLPVMAMLLAASASSIYVAGLARLQDKGLLHDKFEGGMVLHRVSEDLRLALSFANRSPGAVEFAVADQDGDGVDDRIRYEWSGVPGDPLFSQFNCGTVETVAGDVHHFQLVYRSETRMTAPLNSELALLKYNDDAPGGHFHDSEIERNKWCAQYLLPSLPVGTTEWKIKRVRFMAKSDGDQTGVIEVRITKADAALKPTAEVIDAARLEESQLDSSMAWVDVDFTAANQLDPTRGVCLVIAQTSADGKAAKVAHNHGGDPMPGNTHWMTSDNAGESWSAPVDDRDMRFFVYGTYDGYASSAQQYLAEVGIQLQLGADSQSRLTTAVHVLNNPEVVGP